MMNLIFIILYGGCLQLDLIIVADTSGSTQGYEIEITEAITEFNTRFVDSDVHVGLITFSDKPKIQFHLGEKKDFDIQCANTTHLTEALMEAKNELYGPYGREYYKKMILIISDGAPDKPISALQIAQQLRDQGVMVAGVLIESDVKNSEFMSKISDVYVETEFALLSKQLQELDICF